MTTTKRTPNYAAWKFVDKREEFTGSSLRGEAYSLGGAPYLSGRDTWMNDFETERYGINRAKVTYIVWSFYTPIAYFVEGAGWYKVGQSFSAFTGRHRNGALRNMPGHRVSMIGKRGDWTLTCHDCGTERHFTRRNDATQVLYLHGDFAYIMATTPDWDCETEGFSLSDCKHWNKPGTECAGPRVGRTRYGVVLCERHYNES